MSLPHPHIDQISLPNVLAVLGDQTRLAIVGYLARNEGVPMNCGQFLDFGSKTNLSYHLAKLREAGVTRTEIVRHQPADHAAPRRSRPALPRPARLYHRRRRRCIPPPLDNQHHEIG